MQGFGYYLNGISSVAVYGGNDGNRYDQELKSLQLGADVVIATPGRFISHMSLGNVDMSKVSFFVLDEADRMLDMGFSEDIMKIAAKLPKTCQTIMFSATMPPKIEELAKTLLKNPVEIKLAVSKPAEKIQQKGYICYETQKLGIIKDIFKSGDLKRVIIFCGSKLKVKQVNGALRKKNINCGEMHSDLDQAQRDDIMFKFKSGQLDVLVATDIVARGIDIDDIAMVINYDVPHDAEDYVHRIGRTARADRDGVAITLISNDDMFYFQQIEKFLGKEVEKIALPEGLGEAPEYKSAGRPRKGTSAKSRRRNDREQTSHKDKKQQNRRQRNATAERGQPSNKDSRKDQRNDPSRNKRNDQEQRGNKNATQRGEKRGNELRENKNEQRNNSSRPSRNGEQQTRSKRRGNVEGNYKKRNNPQSEKRQANRQQVPQTAAQTIKKESGIKKFIKKIFGMR